MPRLLEDGSTRLLEDGSRRLLEGEVAYVGPTQVGFIYEEHLNPVKKRGKAILDIALSEGQSLQFRRKTPIQTDFNPDPLAVFDATSLEFELDKICFIQQELEGHLCDCRNKDNPEYPGEPEIPGPTDPDPRPECQPYSCSALWDGIVALGFPTWDFTNHKNPITTGYEVTGVNAPPLVVTLAAQVINAESPIYTDLDLCSGFHAWDNNNTTNPAGWMRTPSGENVPVGGSDSVISLACNSGGANTNMSLLRRQVAHLSSGAGNDFTAEIRVIITTKVTVIVHGIAQELNYSPVSGFHVFTAHHRNGVAIDLYIDGDFVATKELDPQYQYDVIGDGYVNVSNYDGYYLYASVGSVTPAWDSSQISSLRLAWDRNQEDYTPPEYCNATFPGDEI